MSEKDTVTGAFDEQELKRFGMIRTFRKILYKVIKDKDLKGSWSDPRRKLQLADYLSLYLFGLYNPVVKSMRALCAATELERVGEEVSFGEVSLGSFSEAQSVVEVDLLRRVFDELIKQSPSQQVKPSIKGLKLKAIDSSVWHVLDRMDWAFWRPVSGGSGNRGSDNAIRVHLEFDLDKHIATRAQMTVAKQCERIQLEKWAKPGHCYIGDRYYGYDYQLLKRLVDKQIDFVIRMRQTCQWVELEQLPLRPEDKERSVIAHKIVRLGKYGNGAQVRIVEVLGQEEVIILATTLKVEQSSAEDLAELYRNRWYIELFFKWIKCILGNRHWFSESPQGVSIQVYLALIAAQLLTMFTRKRPTKRQMELIQFYVMGWASEKEVERLLAKTIK